MIRRKKVILIITQLYICGCRLLFCIYPFVSRIVKIKDDLASSDKKTLYVGESGVTRSVFTPYHGRKSNLEVRVRQLP